jgi:hypothetical protein
MPKLRSNLFKLQIVLEKISHYLKSEQGMNRAYQGTYFLSWHWNKELVAASKCLAHPTEEFTAWFATGEAGIPAVFFALPTRVEDAGGIVS